LKERTTAVDILNLQRFFTLSVVTTGEFKLIIP